MPVKSNMRKFYRWPNPARGEFSRPFGGIVEVLRQYSRFLPIFGWMEVAEEKEADLVVGHLGTLTERLDVFHLHGLMPTVDSGSTGQDFRVNELLIDNIRRARHVICVSDWVADMLRRDMHMAPDVVGHGFDWEVWQEVPAVKFGDTRPKVLWNKTRNFGVCDPTVVIELAKLVPEVDFVTTFLPRGVDARSTPANVKVTGLLAHWEAWGLLKAADVYLGTTKETFGVGALEAMASKIPVVGFLHGATPQVVGDVGLFVQPGDYDGLAELLREALQRKEELGDLGLRRMKDRFSWPKVVRRVADIYEQVLLGTKPKSPRVTVVIPCYNKAQFVAHAIESVQEQSYMDWELIVVDDGSSDGSASVIAEALQGEKRARFVQHTENRGVAHARNTGIAHGTGEYIWCLDADDGCEPTYLQTMVDGLEEDPRLAVVYTGLVVMDASGKLREKVHTWPEPYEPDKGLKGNQIPTSCLYKRLWWERVGGYRQRFAPHGAGQEDADFWFRILASGGGAKMVSEEGMFHYRFHADQVTRLHRDDWKKDTYVEWQPFVKDGKHPIASQLGVPPKGSWAVRDYDRPRVAVVVPVGPYHTLAFIDALDSVEAQTYRNWELIIVNDTAEALDTTAWPYARVCKTEKPASGPGRARNIGTEHAIAPLVVYLDADDVLQPTFIEDTLRAWLDVGGWIYTDFYYFGEGDTHRVYQAADWDSGKLWNKGIAAVTGLYPVEAWREIGGFNEESPHEDWVFHIELALAGWCGTRLAEPLITYRHETGKRRQEGIAGKAFIPIKKRYSKESLMGCNCGKGGGRKKSVVVQRAAAPLVQAAIELTPVDIKALSSPPPDDKFTLVRYVGNSQTDLVFRGRSRRQYIFSTRRRLCWVHQEDVGRIERRAVLQIVDAEELKRAMEPGLAISRTIVEGVHASINT